MTPSTPHTSGMENDAPASGKTARWIKKIGIWGIVFFVVKGTITTTLIVLGVGSVKDLLADLF